MSTPPAHRRSRQRDTIARCLDDVSTFVTIGEAYDLVQRVDSSIGLSTVYRTIHLLVAEGVLDETRHGDASTTLYRRCLRAGAHGHLICRNCAAVVEIAPPEFERWTTLAERAGFTQVSCRMHLLGLCPQCAPARADRPCLPFQPTHD